jgi:SAM-dependent methyltransferase
MNDKKTEHWQSVYQSKQSTDVSWFRPHLEMSLTLLKQAGLAAESRVIDMGAGASTLVDDLLDLGVLHMAALDLSAASLEVAKQRLGERATTVKWLVGDAARYPFAPYSVDLWHDRAVLHFLVDPDDAAAYVANATSTIAPGGYAVIGCFASDGPEKCSGLPVVRREPADVEKLFGAAFTLVDQRHESHSTPWGAPQSFAYSLLRRNA